MPEPKVQPRSRYVDDPDEMGRHGEILIPGSRRGKNMLVAGDPTIPLVEVDVMPSCYTLENPRPRNEAGFLGHSADGQAIIELPRDSSRSPDLPRTKWIDRVEGRELDRLQRGRPLGPAGQRYVFDSVKKEERE